MTKSGIVLLGKYSKAVKEGKPEDVLNDFEEIISDCIEQFYVIDQFYELPIQSIVSIIKRINFDDIDDNFIILEKIINKTTKYHPNDSCLLLNVINCQDCIFSLSECVNLLKGFYTSNLCVKLLDYDLTDNLVNRDYDYDLEQKDQEIQILKQNIENLQKELNSRKEKKKEIHFDKVTEKPEDFEPNLIKAAAEGKLSSVQYLIEICGKDKDLRDEYNCTPLHMACENGHLNIVMYLIEVQNADIEANESRSWTPLHFAAKSGFLDIVEYLCEKGANKESKSYSGATPVLRACLHNKLNVVRYLIENQHVYDGINPKIGSYPIHYGCEKGHLPIVKYFIEQRNVDKELPEKRTGFTPLHLVSFFGHLIIARYLVDEKHANINSLSKKGNTPLMRAATNGKIDIVKFLLSRGADKSIVNQEGETAYSLARNDEIKTLLN